eukprot:COSAG05_NODE_872_length_6839_cov_16.232938_3_plen_33_part_00
MYTKFLVTPHTCVFITTYAYEMPETAALLLRG